jgi:hypothetical protein
MTGAIPGEVLFAEDPPPPQDTATAATAAAMRTAQSLNIVVSPSPRLATKDRLWNLNDY